MDGMISLNYHRWSCFDYTTMNTMKSVSGIIELESRESQFDVIEQNPNIQLLFGFTLLWLNFTLIHQIEVDDCFKTYALIQSKLGLLANIKT